jgi:curved DNA-binding protein CbpA
MKLKRSHNSTDKTYALEFIFEEAELREIPSYIVMLFREAWANNNSRLKYAQFLHKMIEHQAQQEVNQKFRSTFEDINRKMGGFGQFNSNPQGKNPFNDFFNQQYQSTSQRAERIYNAPTTGWWTILGVSKTATKGEIKKAYRDLVKTHHPDKGGDPKKFDEITKAYEEANSR